MKSVADLKVPLVLCRCQHDKDVHLAAGCTYYFYWRGRRHTCPCQVFVPAGTPAFNPPRVVETTGPAPQTLTTKEETPVATATEKTLVTCPKCNRKFEQRGFGPHMAGAHRGVLMGGAARKAKINGHLDVKRTGRPTFTVKVVTPKKGIPILSNGIDVKDVQRPIADITAELLQRVLGTAKTGGALQLRITSQDMKHVYDRLRNLGYEAAPKLRLRYRSVDRHTMIVWAEARRS